MWYYRPAALTDGSGIAPAIAPSAMAQVLWTPRSAATRHSLAAQGPCGLHRTGLPLLHATTLGIVAGHPFVEFREIILDLPEGRL